MKRVSFVVVAALLVGAGFYVARNYGGDGELHLNKDGVHVEQSWLPSWVYQRRTVDYSAMALLRNEVMDSLEESDVIDGLDASTDSPEVSHDQLACL